MTYDPDGWPPKSFNATEIEAMRRTWTGRRIPGDTQVRETISREQLDQLLAIATIYTRGTEVLSSDITFEQIEHLRHADINITGLTFEQSQTLKNRACDAASAHFRMARDWRTIVVDALLEGSPAQDVKALETLLAEADPSVIEKCGYVKKALINDACPRCGGSQIIDRGPPAGDAPCPECVGGLK